VAASMLPRTRIPWADVREQECQIF
jgi:hypothetical protein